MYTQPHTHMHTQHHVHTGWRLPSIFCKPEGSLQDCGDATSGWGYSRPGGQGGRLLLFVHLSLVLCHTHYSLYTKYTIDNIRGIWMSENVRIQQITAADMHWRMKSFVHWKHEYI